MTHQPPQKSVTRVRTYQRDVSHAKESQRVATIKPDSTQAYLQDALEDFANSGTSQTTQKESILAETDDSIFSLDDRQKGTIITDQKTKGGKLRKAVSRSLSGWVQSKKKQVEKIAKPAAPKLGEKIAPAVKRIATIKKATKPKKLGTTANVPLAKKPTTQNVVSGSVIKKRQQVKPIENESPRWTHTVEDSAESKKVKTIEKKFKPTPGSVFGPPIKEVREKNIPAPVVTKKIFKPTSNRKQPVASEIVKPQPKVVMKTMSKPAPPTPASSAAEKVSTEKTSSPKQVTSTKTTSNKPKIVVTPATQPPTQEARVVAPAQLPAQANSERATTTVSEHDQQVAPATAPADSRNSATGSTSNISILASLKSVALLAGLMVILITTFYAGKHFTRPAAVAPTFVASESFFIEDRQTHIATIETDSAIENIKTTAAANEGVARITFTNETEILGDEVRGLPTQFGTIDQSPFVILNFGSQDTAFGTMLSIERQMPGSLRSLFGLLDTNEPFTSVTYDGQKMRSRKDEGTETMSYLTTSRGMVVISDSAASVSKIHALLK